jgi:hypothetical protein
MNMLEVLQYQGLSEFVTSEICGVLTALLAKMKSNSSVTEVLS